MALGTSYTRAGDARSLTMTPVHGVHATPAVSHVLRVLRRRKWLFLQAVVLVPAVAVVVSLRQQELYRSSAEVLLSSQNLAASLTGIQDLTFAQGAERVAQTQADLARVPEVAGRVLEATGLTDRTPADFLEASEVSAKVNADLLVFQVTDPSPSLAARLTTEYARQYTIYRRELDTTALTRARGEVEDQLARLEAEGDRKSPLYAALAEKEQQLRTLEVLQTSNAFLVRPAGAAEKVQPKPVRNGGLGLLLGLVLGLGLAFLRETLDTRVRSAEEIEERLGLPLLARLPEPPRNLRRKQELVMLAAPSGPQAEAFRMLRTNLDFANLERNVRTIMVTSAVEREGKSTTVANLAVALARTGRRVVLVDLDLRRPIIHRFLRLEGRPGLTNVALGQVRLEQALVRLGVSDAAGRRDAQPNGDGQAAVTGILEVLLSGPLPPQVGEFVGTPALAEILEQLAERADLVLIDSPSLLTVGDTMTLSSRVDALLVVTRLNVVRRPMLTELARALEASPAQKLGLVVTGAGLDEGYGYGYGYGYYTGRQHEAKERAR